MLRRGICEKIPVEGMLNFANRKAREIHFLAGRSFLDVRSNPLKSPVGHIREEGACNVVTKIVTYRLSSV